MRLDCEMSALPLQVHTRYVRTDTVCFACFESDISSTVVRMRRDAKAYGYARIFGFRTPLALPFSTRPSASRLTQTPAYPLAGSNEFQRGSVQSSSSNVQSGPDPLDYT